MGKSPSGGAERTASTVGRELEVVPDLHVLATRIEPTTVHPPEQFSTATLSGKDLTYIFFDAKITTPIAVCTRPEARLANENNLLFPQDSGRTTFKLSRLVFRQSVRNSKRTKPGRGWSRIGRDGSPEPPWATEGNRLYELSSSRRINSCRKP